jgi:hypothetical protein
MASSSPNTCRPRTYALDRIIRLDSHDPILRLPAPREPGPLFSVALYGALDRWTNPRLQSSNGTIPLAFSNSHSICTYISSLPFSRDLQAATQNAHRLNKSPPPPSPTFHQLAMVPTFQNARVFNIQDDCIEKGYGGIRCIRETREVIEIQKLDNCHEKVRSFEASDFTFGFFSFFSPWTGSENDKVSARMSVPIFSHIILFTRRNTLGCWGSWVGPGPRQDRIRWRWVWCV